MYMMYDKKSIGENAGIVWRSLSYNEKSWYELLNDTTLTPLELACAIGWLARENKIDVHINGDIFYFSVYHENYF